MFTRKSLLVSALVLSLAVTAPASLSLAKGEKGGHSGSGHAGAGGSGGHHDGGKGGSHDDTSHEGGSHDDGGDEDSHEGGHSGGKGKGPKYKGGRTDPKDHTDSEHGVEEDVFHGKHGARWSDDWKGGKDGHGDDHASEDLLDEEDGHDHH